jgi:hypothetical protein
MKLLQFFVVNILFCVSRLRHAFLDSKLCLRMLKVDSSSYKYETQGERTTLAWCFQHEVFKSHLIGERRARKRLC